MIDNKFSVRRLIRVFSNETEGCVADLELESFDLAKFQQLFSVTDLANPMFDCYEIKPEVIKDIEMHMFSAPEWNFEKYSYFLEADAV